MLDSLPRGLLTLRLVLLRLVLLRLVLRARRKRLV
jgi:hypothetical protein